MCTNIQNIRCKPAGLFSLQLKVQFFLKKISDEIYYTCGMRNLFSTVTFHSLSVDYTTLGVREESSIYKKSLISLFRFANPHCNDILRSLNRYGVQYPAVVMKSFRLHTFVRPEDL